MLWLAALSIGDFHGARDFSVRVAQAIRGSGAHQVVVLDGDCYRMLLTRTRRFGGDLEGIRIGHIVELLAEWIQTDQLKIKKKLNFSVTYHDPCALARYCEDIETPRWILSKILEEPLTEMSTWGKLANCCGAGGMLGVHRPEVAKQVARMRLEEARQTGCDVVATACPRCDTMLRDASRTAPVQLRILNVVQLVAQASGREA
jgi:Fe-S oxidoreductase